MMLTTAPCLASEVTDKTWGAWMTVLTELGLLLATLRMLLLFPVLLMVAANPLE